MREPARCISERLCWLPVRPVTPRPLLVLVWCVGDAPAEDRVKCSSHSEYGLGTEWMGQARSSLPYSRARRFLTLILVPASRARMGARWGILANASAWP